MCVSRWCDGKKVGARAALMRPGVPTTTCGGLVFSASFCALMSTPP